MPKRVYNWTAIQEFHDQGHGFVECQKHFGFSHTAWIKAIKRGRLQSSDPIIKGDRRRKYDWAEIERFHHAGNSYRICQLHFGFAAMSWHKAKLRGEITPRKAGMPIEKLLTGRRSRTHIKIRLLRAGLLENRCSECGLDEWRGKPLSAHIDHINGVKDDNRLENLRMLCPNCHSQTATYSGKNARRKALHDPQSTV